MRKNNKNTIIAVIALVAIVMAGAYALYSTDLFVKGTANIAATWDVKFTGINNHAKSETADYGTPAITNPTDGVEITFDAEVEQKGDYVEYEVVVTNGGNVDATLSGFEFNTEYDPTGLIKYTVTQQEPAEFDEGTDVLADLASGGTHTFIIRAEYNSEYTEPVTTGDQVAVTITFNYTQK